MTEYVERPEPLKGYRELTEDERALVNEIKELEVQAGKLWAKVRATGPAADRATPGADPRMVAHARTVLQDGFMWLVRSVTKPMDVFMGAVEPRGGSDG